MTRREEIEQNALSKYPQGTNRYNKFIEGAKWADKTMIEKACEWIIENMLHYVSKDYTYEVDMADDFRKAMEE